jgi:hypothetical protein
MIPTKHPSSSRTWSHSLSVIVSSRKYSLMIAIFYMFKASSWIRGHLDPLGLLGGSNLSVGLISSGTALLYHIILIHLEAPPCLGVGSCPLFYAPGSFLGGPSFFQFSHSASRQFCLRDMKPACSWGCVY